MSKLDELIKELCPDGVNECKFSELCEYVRGITYNKSQEAQSSDTDYWKILRANNITLTQNTLNFEDIKLIKKEVKIKPTQFLKTGDILICAGSGSKEHVGKVAYIFEDMDYSFGGFMAVIRCNDKMNSRFLFHILTGSGFKNYLSFALNSTTINNLNASVMANFSIPVPPLPVQHEIVRILDSFTESNNELLHYLQSEAELLLKQKAFYLNNLVSYSTQYSIKLLKDIITVSMCKRIKKDQTNSESGIPFYKNGTLGKEADAFISLELYREYKTKYAFPQKGAVMLSTAGTVGRAYIYDGSPAYFQDSNVVWLENDESELLNDYLYWFCVSMPWKLPTRGTIKHLHNDMIYNTPIVIPPKSIQQERVRMLKLAIERWNKLEKCLCTEINSRQYQYEYYRDKLLTFKPLTQA